MVIDRLLSFGIERELIDHALNLQEEHLQGYVLSSTEQEARTLAQIIEQGAMTPILLEEHRALCKRLEEWAESQF